MARELKTPLQTLGPEDYRTIDALLSSGAFLAEGLKLAHRMFPAFASMPTLKKMVYFSPEKLEGLDLDLKR